MASEGEVQAIENYAGARLPDDYRYFLLTQGFMREIFGEVAVLELFPVDEIIPVNEAGEIQSRFPGALVIGGDGSREMLTYDFRDGGADLVLLDITAEDLVGSLFPSIKPHRFARASADKGLAIRIARSQLPLWANGR